MSPFYFGFYLGGYTNKVFSPLLKEFKTCCLLKQIFLARLILKLDIMSIKLSCQPKKQYRESHVTTVPPPQPLWRLVSLNRSTRGQESHLSNSFQVMSDF